MGRDGKKVWPSFKIDGKHPLLRGDRDEEGIARLVWGSLNNASVMFTHTCCHSNGIRGDLEGDFMGRGMGGECCFTVKCLKAPSVSGELLKFRLTVEC